MYLQSYIEGCFVPAVIHWHYVGIRIWLFVPVPASSAGYCAWLGADAGIGGASSADQAGAGSSLSTGQGALIGAGSSTGLASVAGMAEGTMAGGALAIGIAAAAERTLLPALFLCRFVCLDFWFTPRNRTDTPCFAAARLMKRNTQ